jgi:hypothetical protein
LEETMTQHRNVDWEPASPASEQNRTRSLDELASDLRALAVQVTAARLMGLGTGAGSALEAGRSPTPAVRLIGEMLSSELGRILGEGGSRQREEMASLLLSHAQAIQATVGRAERVMRRLEAKGERDDALSHALLDRLAEIDARQEELEMGLGQFRRQIAATAV